MRGQFRIDSVVRLLARRTVDGVLGTTVETSCRSYVAGLTQLSNKNSCVGACCAWGQSARYACMRFGDGGSDKRFAADRLGSLRYQPNSSANRYYATSSGSGFDRRGDEDNDIFQEIEKLLAGVGTSKEEEMDQAAERTDEDKDRFSARGRFTLEPEEGEGEDDDDAPSVEEVKAKEDALVREIMNSSAKHRKHMLKKMLQPGFWTKDDPEYINPDDSPALRKAKVDARRMRGSGPPGGRGRQKGRRRGPQQQGQEEEPEEEESRSEREARKAMNRQIGRQPVLGKFRMKIVEVKMVNKGSRTGGIRRFSVMCVVGNGQGVIGFGSGKGADMSTATRRAHYHALSNLLGVQRHRNHTVFGRTTVYYGVCKVTVYPLLEGNGLRCSDMIAHICRMGGIHDVGIKVHGSRNIRNTVKAVFLAFSKLRDPREIAREQGKMVIERAVGSFHTNEFDLIRYGQPMS